MNYKTCNSCKHSESLFSQHPCYSCNSNTDAAESREFNGIEIGTTDEWEPSDETQAIIEHGFESGRRAGIEEAAKACDIAGKVAHLGMVADICAERIRALLEAKT